MILRLGRFSYDLEYRSLVMGILNRTTDSFYDSGAYFDMDTFWRRAEELAAAGADILDVGGVKAGPGPEVALAEELERVVPAVEGLIARFDLAVSVDTWNAEVARESFAAGAVLGNDISGFADPVYLAVAARAGVGVVATHIRLGPRIADPDPIYVDLVGEVAAFLTARARQATEAGVAETSVIVDAGLDLGKTAEQSLELLRASDRLADLGYPLLVSASNKTFLGRLLGLEIDERSEASIAALALGVCLGARIVRVHDVAGARQAASVLAAMTQAAR
ncbi:MAG: dihydropteroate synthase [Acidimicrobiales bacterium]